MSRKVFLDTNVLLDVLARRQDAYEPAARVWQMAEKGEIAAHVSVISFTNIFYILRKLAGPAVAMVALRRMRNLFTAVPFDGQVLNESLDSEIADLEDAVQYFSAIRSGCDILVTRDLKGFAGAKQLAVISPLELPGVVFPHG